MNTPFICTFPAADEPAEVEIGKTSMSIHTDDDREIGCQIVKVFDLNTIRYIVLLPEDGSSDGAGYLFRFKTDRDGNPILTNIKSEKEYAKASAAFRKLSERQNFEFTE